MVGNFYDAACDYQWTLIELESPTMEATNNGGRVSRGCHHAVEQIRDCRRWLTENALAEQKIYPSLNDKCAGYVVIGRRDGRTERKQKRLADYREQRIELASYDRLLHEAKEHLGHINHNWEEGAKAEPKTKGPPV
jgi:Domain of unknown function (DUF4263)